MGLSLNQAVVYGTSSSIAYGSNVQKGDLLVAAFANAAGAGWSITGVADTQGNTWQQAPTSVEANVQIFFTTAGSTGADTVEVTAVGGIFDGYVFDVTGFAGTPTLDQSASVISEIGTLSIGPLATTYANEFLISIAEPAGAPTGGSPGWTTTISPNNNLFQYTFESSTGSFTATGTPVTQWTGTFVTFGDVANSAPQDPIGFWAEV